ncbi:MAG: methylated-DNA--[protein]-cysteine S-methyltransferase [Candidatus Sphingomonas colombiensis]|nr:methylated-DNA--[protein]-cysteine S-methyltransferase [Sphingomonas sp.]WEK44526.1 MAG: methylated-DNA--[protein]-cysteine S-methyltransferase [Sphingomonas sp.]
MYARDSTVLATPVGRVLIQGGEVVTGITIGVDDAPHLASADALRAAAEQLEAYFAGERRDFDLLLAPASTPRGGVLRAAIAAVGYGETASYGEVARAIGSSPRALGQACRRNPFPIVIPCHRIIGGAGHYSAGDGLPTKNWLLNHERDWS